MRLIAHALIPACLTVMSARGESVTYRTNRVFVPTTNNIGAVTVYNIVTAATTNRLTGIIRSPNPITTNGAAAKEYEGVSWGHATKVQAWSDVFVGTYPSNIADYSEVFADPGWITGTRQAYGKEGAYMWVLQNNLNFTTPGSTFYTNAGKTYLLEKVLVGTLGDYLPGTNYTETFPKMDDPAASNYPGCTFLTSEMPAESETVKYSFDTTAYCRMVPIVVDIDIEGVSNDGDAEEEVGSFIWWNADDDNSNGTPDKDEPDVEQTEAESARSELVRVALSIQPSVGAGTARLVIQEGVDKVRVWSTRTKNGRLSPQGSPPSLLWDLGGGEEPMPAEVYLEGCDGSQSLRDVVLRFSCETEGKPLPGCSDTVKVTVVPLMMFQHSTEMLYGVSWRPNGEYALLVGAEGTVVKYSYDESTALNSGTTERLDAVTWKPDGTVAVTAGGPWPGSANSVGAVLSFTGSAFSGLDTGAVPGYDPEDEFSRQYVKFWGAAWEPGGAFCILVGEHHGTVYRCDGATLTYLNGPDGTDTTVVDWKPDGSYVLTAGDIGADWKWTEADGFSRPAPRLPQTGLLAFAWRPNGSEALIGGTSGRVWKYSEGAGATKLRETSGVFDRINGIAWQPSGKYAIVTGYTFGVDDPTVVLVYDPERATLHEVSVDPKVLLLEKADWKPNGKFAIVVGNEF